MKALIFGDSQTGYVGKEIEKILKAQGFAVTRVVKAGKSTAWLEQYAAKTFPATGWSQVYLLTGGNDYSPQVSSLSKLLTYFKSPKVIYIPLPPATQITNLPLAKKVWGSASSKNKFFPQTAAKREEKLKAYKATANELGVTVKDPRDTPWSTVQPVTQPSGVVFPSQPDGIHAQSGAADIAAYATASDTVAMAAPSLPITPLLIGAVVIAFVIARR